MRENQEKSAESKQRYVRFVLHCGYVESLSIASVTLAHAEGFTNVLDAMEDIRRILLQAVTPQTAACCATAPQGSKFCPKCGQRITKDLESLDLLAANLFRSLWSHNIDSASEEIWEVFDAEGWDLCGNTMAQGKSAIVVAVDRWIEGGGGLNSYMEWFDTKEIEADPHSCGSTYKIREMAAKAKTSSPSPAVKLKSTEECKSFIESIIQGNKYIQRELADHATTDFDASKWKRSSKKQASIGELDYLLEASAEGEEGTWVDPSVKLFDGLTVRIFNHAKMQDGDAAFIILTDEQDHLKAWQFMCD